MVVQKEIDHSVILHRLIWHQKARRYSLFGGNKSCDDGKHHKRAANDHASDLNGLAVLDIVDCFVKLLEIEVLFKPVFASDLQNAAERERACSEQEPEARIGSHAESAHADERADEYAEDRCKQETYVHQCYGRRKFACDEEPVPDGVSDNHCDGYADADAGRSGDDTVEQIRLIREICGCEFDIRAEVWETVNEVDLRELGGCRSPSGAEEKCGSTHCDKQSGNAVEVLFVFKEVRHSRFEDVYDVKSQNDDYEDRAGKKTETGK